MDNSIAKPTEAELIQQIADLNKKIQLFEETNHTAKIGAWEYDIIKNTIFWSKEVYNIHETPANYQPDFEKAIHFFEEEKSYHLITKAVADAIHHELPFDVELLLKTFKGNNLWVRGKGIPEVKNGKVTRLYGTFQNIDEQKRQKIALINSENKHKSIIDHSNNAFFLTKPDGSIIEANPAARELFGYNLNEFRALGRNGIIDTTHPNLPELLKTRAEFGKAHGELAGIKKDGTKFPILISSAIFTDVDGQLATSISIVDNTERKNFQNSLIQKNKELEQFAYGASHDLKEPLRMIYSFMDIIKQKYAPQLDEKANKYIDFAVDGAKRMSILIDELLNYARVGSANQNKEIIHLNHIIDDIAKLQKAIIDEKKVTLEIDSLPEILGFKTGIKQLFQNLISNAIKYQDDDCKPIIKISSIETETHWQFCVADNGIGINENHFNQIFELFKRLHNREKYQGSGLGLAACKKIVEQHGGEIWLTSQEGKGSSFYFTIKKV